jgi:protein gp37
MNQTPIQWADLTINLFIGCTKIHRGCIYCYAIRETNRKINNHKLSKLEREAALKAICKSNGKLNWTNEVTFINKRLELIAARGNARVPKRIFVQSLGDIAHPSILPIHFRYMCNEINEADKKRVQRGIQPDTWIFLSKRPYDMNILFRQWMREDMGGKHLPENWQFGVSVCDQPTTDRLLPDLLRMGDIARVLFVVVEPMLGPVDLMGTPYDPPNMEGWPGLHNPLTGEWWPAVGNADEEYANRITDLPKISGVICGGENGPRPMHPDWPRGLRDQCVGTDTAFFFKQWGTWRPYNSMDGLKYETAFYFPESPNANSDGWVNGVSTNGNTMSRVGKKAAGRELDGKIWDQYPKVRP